MNLQLNAAYLIENGIILQKPNLKKIRENMIKNFIKNTQHFTKGAFENLLNSQMDKFKVGIKNGEYKEDKQEEVEIQALLILRK